MYFSVEEKRRREDLFNREKELKEILDAINRDDRLIIIKGIRRIGKSSVMNVALEVSGLPYIKIDVRSLYAETGFITREVLYRVLELELNRLVGFRSSLRRYLARVKGISLMGGGITFETARDAPFLFEILDSLNEWAEGSGTKLVIALDEAHYFRFSSVRMREIIASSLERRRSLFFILTGSEVGLFEDFLGFSNYSSPLYGRYRVEVILDRFTRDESIRFLVEGFREWSIQPPLELIGKVVDMFDGIVGWLSHFGYWYVTRRPGEKEVNVMLKNFFEEASGVVLGELSKLLSYSPRYRYILKGVAEGFTRWSEIYRYLLVRGVRINRARYNELLKKLVNYGYLAKVNGEYIIPDPVVKYIAENKL